MTMAGSRQVGAFLVLTGAVLAVWSFGDKESTEQHELSSRISTVRLDSPDADIVIRVVDGNTTTIKEKRSYWLVQRGDGYSVDGDTLRLDGSCGWQCKSEYEITVPPGTRVTGDNGTGDLSLDGVGGVDASSRSGGVSLRNVDGDVKLEVTSGDVSIDQQKGALRVDGTSGDVSATHLTGGEVNIETTSGDLRIGLDEPNSVTAKGTSSDIQVTVPTAGYRVDTDTSTGEITDFPGDPGARFSLDAQTVSGDIELAQR
jgi:putative adhesin